MDNCRAQFMTHRFIHAIKVSGNAKCTLNLSEDTAKMEEKEFVCVQGDKKLKATVCEEGTLSISSDSTDEGSSTRTLSWAGGSMTLQGKLWIDGVDVDALLKTSPDEKAGSRSCKLAGALAPMLMIELSDDSSLEMKTLHGVQELQVKQSKSTRLDLPVKSLDKLEVISSGSSWLGVPYSSTIKELKATLFGNSYMNLNSATVGKAVVCTCHSSKIYGLRALEQLLVTAGNLSKVWGTAEPECDIEIDKQDAASVSLSLPIGKRKERD